MTSWVKKYNKLSRVFRKKNTILYSLDKKEAGEYQRSFLSHFREKTVVKKIEEVALFYISNEMVYLRTFAEEKVPIFKKMEYLESVCDPSLFFRINRQMLVCRNSIASFEPHGNRKLELQLNIDFSDKVIVSRLKVANFKKWLEMNLAK